MSNKFALIIGNNEYHDANLAKLAAPVEDVNDLVEVLRDPDIGGFDEVTQIENGLASTVQRAIASFFAKKNQDDLLVLYFSGHSVLNDQGRLYLAFKDTEYDLLSGTAIPTSFISHEMDRCRSRRQVLILDCCHSGAFSRGAKSALGTRVGIATAFEGVGYGRVILTASDSTQFAWEGNRFFGEAVNSLFTHFLIEGIKTGKADLNFDGWISIDELYDYVYERVIKKTPKQTPGKWSYRQNGDILIAKNPHLKLESRKLPKELLQAMESSLVAVRKAIVPELERFLYGSNKALSLAAQEALERLRQDDSRTVSQIASASLSAFEEKHIQTEGQLNKENERKAQKQRETEARKVEEEKTRQISELLMRANSLLKNNEIGQAIEVYKKVLKLDPDNRTAQSELRSAEKKKIQLAVNSLIAKGKSDHDKGAYADALISFHAALKLDPTNPTVRKLIAESEGKQGQTQQINTLLDTGKKYFEQGENEKALKAFNEITAIEPHHQEAIGFVAQIQKKIVQLELIDNLISEADSDLNKKKYEQAAKTYRRILEMDPANNAAVIGLKSAEEALGKKTKTPTNVSSSSNKKGSPKALIFALAAILIIGIPGTWFYLQKINPSGVSGDRVDLSEPATAAKQEMLETKAKAMEVSAEIFAEATYNRGLEFEQRGDQEFEGGNHLTAKLSYNSAHDFFSKSIGEANNNMDEAAKTEIQNQLKEPAIAAKQEVLGLQSEAMRASAETSAAKPYQQAVQALKKGDQAFEAGDFSAAKLSYQSASGFFKTARDEAKRSALEAEADINSIKKIVTAAKQEMLTEKANADKAGGKTLAKALFDKALESEQAGDNQFRKANKAGFLAAQEAYSTARDGYISAKNQAENAVRLQEAAAKLRGEAETAKAAMAATKQGVSGNPEDKNESPAYQNALEKEANGEKQFQDEDFQAAKGSFLQANRLYTQSVREIEVILESKKEKPQEESEEVKRVKLAEQEIQKLISIYKISLEQSDLENLKQFISTDEQKGWSTFFRNVKDIEVSINNRKIDIDNDDATVSFNLVMSYINKTKNEKVTTPAAPKNWKLKASGGRWRVSSPN